MHLLVDSKGIEPSTLRMRTVRSPRLSYEPEYIIKWLRCGSSGRHLSHIPKFVVL